MKVTKAKRGRPRIKNSELVDVFISLRITGKEAKALDDLSKRCGMSRSNFIRRAVEDAKTQVERKSRPKASERTFVDMCRFIIGRD